MADGVKKEEGRSFLCGCLCDSSNPELLEGEVCFCRTKLAVRAATDDPSRDQPSHISPVIWTGGGERKKKNAITAPFFVCHLCHVWRQKHRAALVIMTPPKLIFHLYGRNRCAGSYYLNHARLSKLLYVIFPITPYSRSVLIKPLQCTDSPEATELELHHVLLSIGLEAFCTSLNSNSLSLGSRGV